MIINEHFHLEMFLRDWTQSSILDVLIFSVKLSGACKRKCSAFKIHQYLLSVNLRSFDYIMSK